MKNLLLLFSLLFLVSCGGGGSGGSANNEVTPNIFSLYSGKTTQANLNESNYLDFVRVLYGDNPEVPTTLAARGLEPNIEVSSNLDSNLNTQIIDSMTLKQSQISRRAVNEVGYCEEGTSKITGDLNENTLTGKLVSDYANCTNQGVTINGLVTLEIKKYNIGADVLEHYIISYKELQVTQNNQSVTLSGNSEVSLDSSLSVTTTIDNILRSSDKEVMFEDFTTIATYPNITTMSGKIYLEDHGYVVVSTQDQLVNTRYYETVTSELPGLPTTGGPIQFNGANQTVNLYPQEQGNILQIEYENNSGQSVREGFVDTDYYGPEFVSIEPGLNSKGAPLNSSIIIEYDEPIDPSAINSDDNFLRSLRNSFYKWVPTNTTVSGNKLIITPLEPLNYGEIYQVTSKDGGSTSLIRDMRGNRTTFGNNLDTWSFETVEFGEELSLGFEIDLGSYELDKLTNKLYAVDKENMELAVINLTTDSVEQTYSLPKLPSRMCIDSASDRLYFTSMRSAFVEEYRISDFKLIKSIPWPAAEPYGGPNTTGYHGNDLDIQCKSNELFVVDASFTSQLYSIDRTSPYEIKAINGVDHIGEFHIASSGHIYTWYKNFLGDIKAMEYYPRATGGGWFASDESSFIYRQRTDDPLYLEYQFKDAPIFVDESKNIVINERYVFDKNDLSSVLHDFGENKVIYTEDFVRNRVASSNEVYSTDDYSNTLSIPIYDVDETLFDNEGDLYIIKNKNKSLYRVKESEM